MTIRCFFLTPTERVRISLRRFVYSRVSSPCTGRMGYHDAEVVIGEADQADESVQRPDATAAADPRWPKHCSCGYEFTSVDEWQVNNRQLYRRSDTGELTTLHEAPVGAMWFPPWMSDVDEWRGPDGQTLVVRLPPSRHDWIVDGRASNCDSPCSNCGNPYHAHRGGACPGAEERVKAGTYVREQHAYRDARPHKCWIRHGAPPDVTVDKNGVTCGAGAGSIAVTGWHGFLRAGCLVE